MPSLNPADFVRGGLANDIDVEVVRARYDIFDYGGTVQGDASRFSLRLELRDLKTGEEFVEHLTAGKPSDFVPSKEDGGKTMVSVSGKQQLNRDSNLFLFLQSIADLKIDMSPLADGDASRFDGFKFHLVRKPAPKRTGLSITRKNPEQEATYVAVQSVIYVPWLEKSKKEEPKPSAGNEAEELAKKMIVEVAPDGMTPKDLALAAMKKMAKVDPAVRRQTLSLLGNITWLESTGLVIAEPESGVVTFVG